MTEAFSSLLWHHQRFCWASTMVYKSAPKQNTFRHQKNTSRMHVSTCGPRPPRPLCLLAWWHITSCPFTSEGILAQQKWEGVSECYVLCCFANVFQSYAYRRRNMKSLSRMDARITAWKWICRLPWAFGPRTCWRKPSQRELMLHQCVL